MSSSSVTGLSPKVFDPSHTSSSSPSNVLENFNPNTASPAVKYRIFSERINELISPEDRRNNPGYHRPLIQRADIISPTTEDQLNEDQFNPVIVGSGVALGTGTIAEVSRRALRSPIEPPIVYCSPTIPEIPSSSSTFISNYGRIALIGTICIFAGATTYKTMTAYQSFERDLNGDIETNFNDITSTSQLLLERLNELITRKERSWFGRIFANRNPDSMGKLLLKKGLALDSIRSEPLRRHQEAQQQYQMALTYTIVDNSLRYRIQLAYARSLRLTNSPDVDLLAQLSQIPHDSPLADVEYEPFAAALSTRIRGAFDDIVDPDVTPHQLLEKVDELISRKETSWFNQAFADRDPNSIGHLMLTKGIALDSIAINLNADNPESLLFHQEAQQQYQTALNTNLDNDLRDRIHLAYARSLRLTNSPEAHVLAQLDRISQDSPFYAVAEIERRALHGQPGEIMDRYQYPFEFLCPITQDIMVNPLYHIHEEHRYYFEGNAIQAWLVTHDTCPLSRRRPLTPEHLSPDDEHRNVILSWSPTKLMQNIVGS